MRLLALSKFKSRQKTGIGETGKDTNAKVVGENQIQLNGKKRSWKRISNAVVSIAIPDEKLSTILVLFTCPFNAIGPSIYRLQMAF